ncbi:MAG TPA: c-type cytochrome [Longimicrobiales bacterium]
MKRWMRRIVIGCTVLAGLGLVLVAGVYGFSSRRLNRRFDVPAGGGLTIVSDSAHIARGRHLVAAVTPCMACHGADLGGAVLMDAGPLIGRIYAPNLTRGEGGIGATFSDADWVRAVRYGVGPDGRGLMIMPIEAFRHLSDEDLADIIAYVKSRPPVGRETERSTVGPLVRVLYLLGKFPILPAESMPHDGRRPVSSPPRGATAEYGAYLTHIAGCVGCHGPDLSGGPAPGAPPGTPPAQDLTPAGIGSWTEQDFFHAIRLGQRPDGSAIDTFMPWLTFRNMTDDELRAIWLYLKTLPPSGAGGA